MGQGLESGECVTSLRVCNSHSVALTFCLEPWGEQYPMASEAIFDVVARGPKGDSLEVELTAEQIVLYGWPGSRQPPSRRGDGAVSTSRLEKDSNPG
jgi:hypothetical protein